MKKGMAVIFFAFFLLMFCNRYSSDNEIPFQGEDWEFIAMDDSRCYFLSFKDKAVYTVDNSNQERNKIFDIGSYRYITSFFTDSDWIYFCCFQISGNGDHVNGEFFRMKFDGTQVSTKTIYDNTRYSRLKDHIYFCKTYSRNNEDFYQMNLDLTEETRILEGISAKIYPDNQNEWLYYEKDYNLYRYHIPSQSNQVIVKREDCIQDYMVTNDKYQDIWTEYQDLQIVDDRLSFSLQIFGFMSGNGGKPVLLKSCSCNIKLDGSGLNVTEILQ